MLSKLITFVLWCLLSTLSLATANAQSCSSGAVRFEIHLTWGPVSPDGFTRNGILTNGQFPGPQLNVNQYDDVEFIVHNHLPNGTAIHFHGIEQLYTPWSDGVPGLSQRLIPPGESFLYRWNANEYGTYWYHAHSRSQISDGLLGAIVIKPGSTEPTAFRAISNDTAQIAAMRKAEDCPIPLIVADWNHFTSEEFGSIIMAANTDDVCFDSILINGKGSEICLPQEEINSLTNPALLPLLNGTTLTAKGCLPKTLDALLGHFTHNFSALPPTAFDVCVPSVGPTEVIQVDPADEWASINIINAGAVSSLGVSVDEHPMWIYAADGKHIQPVLVDVVQVPNGNRFSALVKLDKPAADYTIRVTNLGANQIISGFATLSYKGSNHNTNSTPFINYAGQNLTKDVVYLDDSKVVPFPPIAPARTADVTYFLDINRFGTAWRWTLSGKESYGLDLEAETPLLFDPTSAEATNPNLTITTKMGQWVDLVVQVESPPIQPAHPLHKHSNKAFIIGEGSGRFNWSTTAEAIQEAPQFFNLDTPPLRDGFTTIPTPAGPTWIVIRYQVVNPGAFLFHCHIQFHLSPGGMAVAIIDGIDALPVVPSEYLNGNGFS